jgi:hypothetical protein
MIDPETLQLATPSCPVTREEVFVRGTEPTEFCVRHGGRMMAQIPPASWLSRLFGGGKSAAPQTPGEVSSVSTRAPVTPTSQQPAARAAESPVRKEGKKKGFFNRIFGIFGGNKKDQDKPLQKLKPTAGETP